MFLMIFQISMGLGRSRRDIPNGTTQGQDCSFENFFTYWCHQKSRRLDWIYAFNEEWAKDDELFKLLGIPFGLNPEVKKVDGCKYNNKSHPNQCHSGFFYKSFMQLPCTIFFCPKLNGTYYIMYLGKIMIQQKRHSFAHNLVYNFLT